MRIVELAEGNREDYLSCMEEWSEDMMEGVPRKACWVDRMLGQGLRVKLALTDGGTVAGMIQYAPIEHSWAEGENLYFVYCIWVHGHRKGRGDLRKRGAGCAMLKAAEEDVRELGGAGLAVWGMVLPVFMRARWFRKHGYRRVDRDGISALLWKPFRDGVEPPRWIRAKKVPEKVPGKVLVTALSCGWCTGMEGMVDRARRISAEFGDSVVYREVDTSRAEVVREWGLSGGLFVDDRNIYRGPPLTGEQIRRAIAKRVGKLKPTDGS